MTTTTTFTTAIDEAPITTHSGPGHAASDDVLAAAMATLLAAGIGFEVVETHPFLGLATSAAA